MLKFKEIEYWNNNSYGSAFRVRKNTIVNGVTAVYSVAAVAIPFFVPIWIAPIIKKSLNKYITKDAIIRYDKEGLTKRKNHSLQWFLASFPALLPVAKHRRWSN
jgi:hypothetical protein